MKYKIINKSTKCVLTIMLILCLFGSTGFSAAKMDHVKKTKVWAGKTARFVSVDYGKRNRRKLFTITAYCSGPCCCEKYADGFTATGKRAREENRIVAVDPVSYHLIQ